MKRWIVSMFILSVLLLLARVVLPCGVERWAVKTLQDPSGEAAAAVEPSDDTIEDLIANVAPARVQLQAATATRFAAEKRTYRVKALLLGFKAESDQDFHIVLASPANPSVTMIAEIPSGACASASRQAFFNDLQAQFASRFGQPSNRFKRLAHPVPVTVTGVFFFDYAHGQTGLAPNGGEIHPVLKIE